MKHTSVPVSPVEIIDLQPLDISPLISKCAIKVCYVSDDPNRNKSVITKKVAEDSIAPSLRGSPIVGYYNKAEKDFEEHNRSLDIDDTGHYIEVDDTRPYGFVDLNAKCWFQKFLDDGINEHEYLMTEGYIWTGQYPEANRIVEHGNNQSMELDEKNINAFWTKNEQGKPQFFIINEAIISKLCILGEEYEPCFEGSSITKLQYSFDDDFKERLFSMIKEITNILNEGRVDSMPENEIQNVEEVVNDAPAAAEEVTDFACGGGSGSAPSEDKKKKEDYKKEDSESKDEKKSEDEKPAEDEASDSEEKKDEKKQDEEDKSDKNKKQYILEEIPEYIELTSKYSALENDYNNLKAEKEDLLAQNKELNNFKLNVERHQKEDMINNTFYMLSDEDKKDVVDNIDKYTLDEIEAKLSILCVRNKVSFAALEDEPNNHSNTTFNIADTDTDDSVPAWIKAVLDTAKTLN